MMHETAREYLLSRIRVATSPGFRDQLLEQLYDADNRATDWDARQWGFQPDKWMAAERLAMRNAGGCDWPAEVV